MFSSTWSLKTTIYESGTASAFTDDRIGAASLWMVSVLNVGADDAKAAREMAITAERMMTSRALCRLLEVSCVYRRQDISTRQEGRMDDDEIESSMLLFEEEAGSLFMKDEGGRGVDDG